MTEEEKKAIDFAADIAKQMVTLSTGIVTITILFSKEIAFGRSWAVAAWVVFLISTLAGLWTLMSLTGTLFEIAKGGAATGEPIKLSLNVLVPARVQVFTFVLAILFTIGFVISSTTKRETQTPATRSCCAPRF